MFSKLITAVFAMGAILVPSLDVNAAALDSAIGIPGLEYNSKVQIAEMRVSYRFDQMGSESKEQNMIPVQTTYRLHNTGNTETLSLGIPLPEMGGRTALLTAIYINGQEVPAKSVGEFKNQNGSFRAAQVDLTVLHESDAILDIRLLEPQQSQFFPFLISTGAGWLGPIGVGSVEGIFPYDTAVWNVALRKTDDKSMMPLVYSGRSATWSFQDLNFDAANDFEWIYADVAAMDLYKRGNDRWAKTGGDAKSYSAMRSALLEMIPCNGRLMPDKDWWLDMYDTVTTGVIATTEPESAQLAAALELWSDGWRVAEGDNAECIALRQRPDRYRAALKKILEINEAQRDSVLNEVLKNHYNFLQKMAARKGDDSLAVLPAGKDPYGEDLSENDKKLLGEWDQRFLTADQIKAMSAADNEKSTASSSTSIAIKAINKIKDIFPNLSFWSQVILFGLLILIALIVIALIFLRWKEKQDPPAFEKKSVTGSAMPRVYESPSFIPARTEKDKSGIGEIKIDELKKDETIAKAPEKKEYKPPVNFPPPKKMGDEKKDFALKDDQQFKKGDLDEAYKNPEPKIKNDMPWIKADQQTELIKPKAPPPQSPAPNNIPWQKKNDDNEHKPGPTVNI